MSRLGRALASRWPRRGCKVTVVVPVYNPGENIEVCISSLLRQSMPAGEFEAIFVDDGSTDTTPARLDALAAEHEHVRVIHQPNSGWPGRPRNVGIDHARGEYVAFLDHDDWLGDEALERMYAYGVENDADVVIGKMVGIRRTVPVGIFRENRPRATLQDAPLIDSLTPHKMFRRAMLDRHGLRFPEGRRRLEDHVFVTAAYFLAGNVSVLSDYTCYYHIRREDDLNAGFQLPDPASYFDNLREALDIVERNTEPGPFRDRLYRRWYRTEMIEKLRTGRLLRRSPEYREAFVEQVRAVAAERFSPEVGAALQPMQRVISDLVLAGLVDDLAVIARWEQALRTEVEVGDVHRDKGRMRLEVTAELRADGEPVLFREDGDRVRLVLPPLSAEGRAAVAPGSVDATDEIGRSRLDLFVRSRRTESEYPLAAETHAERVPHPGAGSGAFRLLHQGRTELDRRTAASGRPLPHGAWDIRARIDSCGWVRVRRSGVMLKVPKPKPKPPPPPPPSVSARVRRRLGAARRRLRALRGRAAA